MARHPQRPYSLDYIAAMCTDFEELHGDRHYADDAAIVGGLARFNGQSVMVIGHQKGRDTKDRQYRNFGMPRPGAIRKALRMMRTGGKIRHFIPTSSIPPAHIPAWARKSVGSQEAIGYNLYELAGLKVPVICTIIGEGGSGGALAIAVGT